MARTGKTLIVLVIAAVMAACASPPSAPESDSAGGPPADGGGEPSPPDDGGTPAAEGGDASALQQIYDEIDGLDWEARRERLIELAEDEGELSLYASTNIEDMGPVIDAFEDETDVDVSFYRGSSANVLQRVLQEAQAEFAGSDVVSVNAPSMYALEDEGLLAPLQTPVAEEIIESGRHERWLAPYLNVYIAMWNPDRITEPPGSWEEVLTGYPGQLALEATDFDWFAMLVQEYFMEELGMTEEEAVDVFREAAPEAVSVKGHSVGSNLVAAGEYGLMSSGYHHHLPRFPEEALAWQPPVEPLVVQPHGLAIHTDVRNPASALLLVDFILREGQSLFVDVGRTPGNTTVEGGLSADVRTVGSTREVLIEDREKWESLYEEIINLAGRGPEG